MNALDIAVILLIAAVALISAKRGFIWSILNFAAVVLAGVLSKMLAAPASELFDQYFLHGKIITELYKILPEGSVSGQIGAGIESVLNELPLPVVAIAKQFGLYPDLSGGTQVLTVEGIEEDYIIPIIVGVLSVVAAVILFIIFCIVLKIVARAVDHHFSDKDKHKFISRTNTLVGGIVGVVKGVIPAGFLCVVLDLLAPTIGNDTLTALVNGSFFCKLIGSVF